MYHFNCYITERQIERLRDLAAVSELSIGELVRRILDDSLHVTTLDRLVPYMSGQWSETGRK